MRLLLVLVVGPFLILFLFGLGYERTLPELATVVVGEGGTLTDRVDTFIRSEEPAGIDYRGTTRNEQAALEAGERRRRQPVGVGAGPVLVRRRSGGRSDQLARGHCRSGGTGRRGDAEGLRLRDGGAAIVNEKPRHAGENGQCQNDSQPLGRFRLFVFLVLSYQANNLL